MALVNTGGRNKRFKSNAHSSAYHAKRRANKGNLRWAFKPPEDAIAVLPDDFHSQEAIALRVENYRKAVEEQSNAN